MTEPAHDGKRKSRLTKSSVGKNHESWLQYLYYKARTMQKGFFPRPEMERYFLPLTGSSSEMFETEGTPILLPLTARVRLKNKRNPKVFEVKSKSFETSSSWPHE